MKYLKIQNDGILDIRLVALMGGTTKTNDKYKIGQFGTGLKYTLAYLLRNNVDFKIFSGETKVNIGTEVENIAGTDFEIICIEGNRTSITTQMGRQWMPWMIVRELWCNALDEGGNVREIVDDSAIAGKENATTFYIQMLPDIQEVWENWSNYFLHHKTPLWENEEYGIYATTGKEPLRLYKQGVLIYQHTDVNSLFWYDIKGAEINELREFKGSHSFEIFQALRNPGPDVVSYFLNHITDEHYEGSQLDYDWYNSFASVWRDALGGRKIYGSGSGSYEGEIDFDNVLKLPQKVYKALVKQFDGVGALAMADNEAEFFEIQNTQLENKVNDCLSILRGAGYELNQDVRVKYGMFSDNRLVAASNRNRKTIMVSEVSLKMPDEELINYLVENNEYIIMSHKKDSSNFFRHFINLYTKQLLRPNEVEI